jgi:hypothetical protein
MKVKARLIHNIADLFDDTRAKDFDAEEPPSRET